MENESSSAITFLEYIGQKQIIFDIEERIRTSKTTGVSLEHILLCGPLDMGKRTLAAAIGNELGINWLFVHANEIEKPADLAGILTCGKIIVLDEFKGLKKNLQEYLYQAMTNSKIDILIDSGPPSRYIQIEIATFTLIILATKPWDVIEKFRRWFLVYDFTSYSLENLRDIILNIAVKEGIKIELKTAELLANYCNGKPGNAEVIIKRIVKASKYSTTVINDENILEIINYLGYGKTYPKSLTLADKFSKMSGIEFERWVADHFRGQGFDVRETETIGDHGIDLLLYKSNNLIAVVQCKCWDGVVGEPTIREFFGSLISSKAPLGYMIITSSFSQHAINFSNDKPIKLIDLEALINLEINYQ